MHTVTAKLPDDLNERLEHLAEELDRKKSYIIRQAIQNYLEEKEDYLIALARIAKKGKRYSLEEIAKESGLES